MEKITLNLIVPGDMKTEEYSVIGDCKELGNWRRSLKMKLNYNKKLSCLQKLKEIDNDKKYAIYSLSFEIFRGKSKINYCYMRKA